MWRYFKDGTHAYATEIIESFGEAVVTGMHQLSFQEWPMQASPLDIGGTKAAILLQV